MVGEVEGVQREGVLHRKQSKKKQFISKVKLAVNSTVLLFHNNSTSKIVVWLKCIYIYIFQQMNSLHSFCTIVYQY